MKIVNKHFWTRISDQLRKDHTWLVLLSAIFVFTHILATKSISKIFSPETIVFFGMGFFKKFGKSISKGFKKAGNAIKTAAQKAVTVTKKAVVTTAKAVGKAVVTAATVVKKAVVIGATAVKDSFVIAGKAIAKGVKKTANIFADRWKKRQVRKKTYKDKTLKRLNIKRVRFRDKPFRWLGNYLKVAFLGRWVNLYYDGLRPWYEQELRPFAIKTYNKTKKFVKKAAAATAAFAKKSWNTVSNGVSKAANAVGNYFKSKPPWVRTTLAVGTVIAGALLTPTIQKSFNANPVAPVVQTVRCGFLNLSKCTPTPQPTATFTPTSTELPTLTFTPAATNTPTSTSSPTSSPTPTATELVCLTHISPANNQTFGSVGRIPFEWNPQDGAASYNFTLYFGDGDIVYTEQTTNTSVRRFLESIPKAGQYGWYVIAFAANGEELCRSEAWHFEKTQFITDTPAPAQGGLGSGPPPKPTNTPTPGGTG